MSFTRFAGLMTAAVLAVGTASGQQRLRDAGLTGTPVIRETTLPPAATGNHQDYRIGAGDVISVDIWKDVDASSMAATVRADGMVSLRLVGEVSVVGKTAIQVQDILTEKYSAYLRNPYLTVSVKEMNSQVVYLIGEVKKAGAVHFQGPITVLQAISEAGGLTDYARRRKIYVLRANAEGQKLLPFDYDAVLKGQKIQQNVILGRGDTIVVPR